MFITHLPPAVPFWSNSSWCRETLLISPTANFGLLLEASGQTKLSTLLRDHPFGCDPNMLQNRQSRPTDNMMVRPPRFSITEQYMDAQISLEYFSAVHIFYVQYSVL
jgi:hypothetical protein